VYIKMFHIKVILESRVDGPALSTVPFVSHLLTTRPDLEVLRAHQQPTRSHLPIPQPLTGNLDLAVLRLDTQNPTHVTPLIASLAKGYFRESFRVIGPPPCKPDRLALEQKERQIHDRVRMLVEKASKSAHHVALEFHPTERIRRDLWFYRSVEIDGVRYAVGVAYHI
jgi:DNA (cytosine-5)-methyltransferase 1